MKRFVISRPITNHLFSDIEKHFSITHFISYILIKKSTIILKNYYYISIYSSIPQFQAKRNTHFSLVIRFYLSIPYNI